MEESAGGTDRGSTAPLHLKWAGITFIVLALLIAITAVTGLKKHFFGVTIAEKMQIRRVTDLDEMQAIREALPADYMKDGIHQLPSGLFVEFSYGRIQILERAEILMSTGKMYTVLLTILLFILSGFFMGFFTRLKRLREMAIAGGGGVIVLWIFWLWGAGWDAGKLVTETLHIQSDSVLMQMPSSLFLLTLCIVCIGATVGASSLGSIVSEWIRKKTVCPHCNEEIPIKPTRPPACPKCGEKLTTERFNWIWVTPSVISTSMAFYLFVLLLGAPLGFYFQCDFKDPSESCRKGMIAFREARQEGSTRVIVWRKRGKEPKDEVSGVVLHSWKYVLFPSLIFFFAPFFTAWKSGKKALASAGLIVVANWIGATGSAMLFLRFAQFEGVFMNSLRLHVMAAVPWCIVGALGALVGHRLGAEKNMFAELDEATDSVEPN